MSRKVFFISLLALLAMLLAACGPSASEKATATAMANQLATANAQVTAIAATQSYVATQSVLATQSAVATQEWLDQGGPLLGNWIDAVKDTWEFKAGGQLHAVSGGKPYDTTWSIIDSKTIKIDFGPILNKVGDPNANLTVTYVVVGDKLTLTFTNGNAVYLDRVK
jgi:hypothetical protein